MKIMTCNNYHAPALRQLAESHSTVGAVAVPVPGAVIGWAAGQTALVGRQHFVLLDSVPALPTTTPGSSPKHVLSATKQASDLELMVRDFVLPSIKLAWPDASMVVTGVELVWAGKEFWDQASDEHADTTKTTIAGVRLASKAVGLFLSLEDAPSLAVGTNAIAGLLIATTDKMYSAKLKRA